MITLPGDPGDKGPLHFGEGGDTPTSGGGGTGGFTSFTGIGGASPFGTAPSGFGVTPNTGRRLDGWGGLFGAPVGYGGQPFAGAAATSAPMGGRGMAQPNVAIGGGGAPGGPGGAVAGGDMGPGRVAAPNAPPPGPGGLGGGYGGSENFFREIYNMLQQFAGGGSFSPGGSSALMEAMNHNARQRADALTHQAMNAADVYGMDPGQMGATHLQALMGTDKDVANLMGQANYSQLAQQQQFGQQLLAALLGFNTNMEMGNNDYIHQHLLGAGQGQGMNWGALGSALGTGAGWLLGGPAGGTLGGTIGGGLGGFAGSHGNQQASPYTP